MPWQADWEAELLKTVAALDQETAAMEQRIAAGEVTDPSIIAMVRRTRDAISNFRAGDLSYERTHPGHPY